jgi:hypothetical protein
MEASMLTRLLAAAGFVVLIVTFSVSRIGINVYAATDQSSAPHGATQSEQASMQDMMTMHERMMADMKAADARLDALVREMNAATGDAKVRTMATVVNELVQQHKALHGRMGQMHQHMMGGRGMMMRQP